MWVAKTQFPNPTHYIKAKYDKFMTFNVPFHDEGHFANMRSSQFFLDVHYKVLYANIAASHDSFIGFYLTKPWILY